MLAATGAATVAGATRLTRGKGRDGGHGVLLRNTGVSGVLILSHSSLPNLAPKRRNAILHLLAQALAGMLVKGSTTYKVSVDIKFLKVVESWC